MTPPPEATLERAFDATERAAQRRPLMEAYKLAGENAARLLAAGQMTVPEAFDVLRLAAGWLGILERAGVHPVLIEAVERHAEMLELWEREQEAHYFKTIAPQVRKDRDEWVRQERPETRTGMVSEDRIVRARGVPIADLLETTKGGYGECPACTKKRMWTKGGFGHCFSCQWSGDSIKYLVEKGRSFVQAVAELAP